MVQMVKSHKRHNHEHREDLAGEYRQGDTGQVILLIIFIIGMISDSFLLKLSNSWHENFPWYFRIVVFISLFFLSGFFAQQAHKKVLHEERKQLMLIQTHLFTVIRHPMYFGSILIYLGFVVLSFSLIALVVFISLLSFIIISVDMKKKF